MKSSNTGRRGRKKSMPWEMEWNMLGETKGCILKVVMARVDESEWTEMTTNLEEVVSVVGAVVIGEAGAGKPEKSNLDELIDEGNKP